MRLTPEIRNFFKQSIDECMPDASVYLFGSRTDDHAKGGDIDLMILTKKPADNKIMRKIRLEFYKKFGWQKVDMVNFTYSEQSSFRELIMDNCILL